MPIPLQPEQLYAACDPTKLGFNSNDELPIWTPR